MEGAVATGRHIRLEHTGVERLLRDGLVAMQIDKDRDTALRLFRRASEKEPNNYLPCLYEASISPNPAERLQKAIQLHPTSVKARIMLGDLLAENGNLLEAVRCYSEAAELFSEYEIPFLRAASLLERAGHHLEAEQLNQKAKSLTIETPHTDGPAAAPPPSPPSPPGADTEDGEGTHDGRV